uniref:Uncharacterized protein n=1 Tax=Lygus hesperus TaxID=30085 RepID=A0A146L018_LYGHE
MSTSPINTVTTIVSGTEAIDTTDNKVTYVHGAAKQILSQVGNALESVIAVMSPTQRRACKNYNDRHGELIRTLNDVVLTDAGKVMSSSLSSSSVSSTTHKLRDGL